MRIVKMVVSLRILCLSFSLHGGFKKKTEILSLGALYKQRISTKELIWQQDTRNKTPLILSCMINISLCRVKWFLTLLQQHLIFHSLSPILLSSCILLPSYWDPSVVISLCLTPLRWAELFLSSPSSCLFYYCHQGMENDHSLGGPGNVTCLGCME